MFSKKMVLAVSVASALTACGGGGSDSTSPPPPPPVTTAEGAYNGTVTHTTNASAFSAVLLEDGQIWQLYGSDIGGSLIVSGLMQGQGVSSNGSFTSTTTKDFGLNPAPTFMLNASYVAGVSLKGTYTFGAASASFAGTAIPAAQFNYNTPASLPSVVGNWSMSEIGGNMLAVTIAANGTFTMISNSGCTTSGTVAARTSGKNIFDVQMIKGPAPCSGPGLKIAGIGIYTTLANGTHQFIMAVVDVSRMYGTAAFGTR